MRIVYVYFKYNLRTFNTYSLFLLYKFIYYMHGHMFIM